MRYIIALIIAALIIVAAALFAWRSFREIDQFVRDGLRKQQQPGQLPPELQNVDVDSVDLNNFKIRLPYALIVRLELARWISRVWYIWAPVLIAVCLGLAALYGRLFSRKSKVSSA